MVTRWLVILKSDCRYLVKRIKEMPEKFHLIQEPEMVNVLFWYIPQRLRDQPQSKERIAELGRVGLIFDFLFFITQY